MNSLARVDCEQLPGWGCTWSGPYKLRLMQGEKLCRNRKQNKSYSQVKVSDRISAGVSPSLNLAEGRNWVKEEHSWPYWVTHFPSLTLWASASKVFLDSSHNPISQGRKMSGRRWRGTRQVSDGSSWQSLLLELSSVIASVLETIVMWVSNGPKGSY